MRVLCARASVLCVCASVRALVCACVVCMRKCACVCCVYARVCVCFVADHFSIVVYVCWRQLGQSVNVRSETVGDS